MKIRISNPLNLPGRAAWPRRLDPNRNPQIQPAMKTKLKLAAFCPQLSANRRSADAQGAAFTHQGQFQNNGGPASDTYNLTFSLFNTNNAGVAIAGPVTHSAVSVTNGLFPVRIDFGPDVFTGTTTNWPEIGVATNGADSITTLPPRQQVVDSPPAPAILSSLRSDGTNFVFNFSTVLSQSYTVWANANLATTNWGSYTNLIGDGYFQETTIPLTNSPQSFFQLTSP